MSLIELLIVVAIIGILANMGVPAYSNFMVEQRRADARHLLNTNAQLLQRCLTLVGRYDGGVATNVDGDCNVITESSEGHYEVTKNLAAQTWSLTAAAVADGKQQSDTDCTSLTLDHIGRRTATGDTPDDCW